MKVLVSGLAVLFLVISQQVFAGFSSSDSDFYKFRYDIKGEINIRPDRAVFPVVITVRAGSYKKSLDQANQLVADLRTVSRKLNTEVFSITSEDFTKNTPRRKKISLSFFGDDDDKNKAVTKLVSFLVVNFTELHDFSNRSEFIAEALDFIDAFKAKHGSNERVNINAEDVFYEIADVEQYREKIVSSVYHKAKVMAEIIGKHEKVSPRIKEVYFDQYISEEILGFNKASLYIGAKIEYTFR